MSVPTTTPCLHGRLQCVYCPPPKPRPPHRCAACNKRIADHTRTICVSCERRGVEAPSLFEPWFEPDDAA